VCVWGGECKSVSASVGGDVRVNVCVSVRVRAQTPMLPDGAQLPSQPPPLARTLVLPLSVRAQTPMPPMLPDGTQLPSQPSPCAHLGLALECACANAHAAHAA